MADLDCRIMNNFANVNERIKISIDSLNLNAILLNTGHVIKVFVSPNPLVHTH